MKHGLVVGKFYPPHIGHHKLIEVALSECDLVTVAVCYSSVENISADDRVEWLSAEHPTAEFIKVFDDTPVEYTDETWNWFLEALMYGLDNRPGYRDDSAHNQSYPGIVYSGEDYAPEFARRLDGKYDERVFRQMSEAFPKVVEYRTVDRHELPVSASLFRSDPAKAWELLRPAAKAGLAKRIVMIGAESSGTTTLAKALAEHYDTVCVPEYGRYFDWAVGLTHQWTDEDFIHIAQEQQRWEDNLARRSRNGLLICDTDAYATDMFSEVYLDHRAVGIEIMLRKADFYIITDHSGVEFVDDGQRVNGDKRGWMTNWFTCNSPHPWILVKGPHEERLEFAVERIDALLSDWGIEEPLEYRND